MVAWLIHVHGAIVACSSTTPTVDVPRSQRTEQGSVGLSRSSTDCEESPKRTLSLLQLRRGFKTLDPTTNDADKMRETQRTAGCTKDCTDVKEIELARLTDNSILKSNSDVGRHMQLSLDDELTEDSMMLNVNHNAKCGGTFVLPVLKRSVPSMSYENEWTNLWTHETSNPHRNTADPDNAKMTDFLIGLVRDPFSYYVSMWAFNSCKAGAFRNALTKKEQHKVYASRAHCEAGNVGADPDDRERFRNWLNLVIHPDVGLASMRFYFKYVRTTESGINWMQERPGKCLDEHGLCVENGITADTIKQAFSQFGPQKDKLCWVVTGEHIVDTLRACLGTFEEVGGYVDWKAFDTAVSDASVKRNASPHGKISDMYDEASVQKILTADQYLFQHFSFPLSPQA